MIVLLNVYIYALRKKSAHSSSWGHSKIYTPGTIANSQSDRAPTRIIKNGAVVKVRILVKLGILYMTHLKTFRVIFNEMPVFFLISY